jgi:hypothetical protein
MKQKRAQGKEISSYTTYMRRILHLYIKRKKQYNIEKERVYSLGYVMYEAGRKRK